MDPLEPRDVACRRAKELEMSKVEATEPEGVHRPKGGEALEDDVEGHSHKTKAIPEDDVEGHSHKTR
jgi:hypothetical protein